MGPRASLTWKLTAFSSQRLQGICRESLYIIRTETDDRSEACRGLAWRRQVQRPQEEMPLHAAMPQSSLARIYRMLLSMNSCLTICGAISLCQALAQAALAFTSADVAVLAWPTTSQRHCLVRNRTGGLGHSESHSDTQSLKG